MDLVEQRLPWAPPTFAISSKDAAIRALQDPRLLDSFFSRLKDMCTLISAASGTSSADVSLAWEMTELKKVNVLVYGQTGAGKSTLIGEIIGQASLGGASTKEVSISKTASGIAFVDRPGIDIPGAQGTSAEAASDCQQAWFTSALRSVSTWANEQVRRGLDDLNYRAGLPHLCAS